MSIKLPSPPGKSQTQFKTVLSDLVRQLLLGGKGGLILEVLSGTWLHGQLLDFSRFILTMWSH